MQQGVEMADDIKSNDIRRTNVPPAVKPDVVDDRAQPGDVLGIERDGERTHLGETAEEEDERREDAIEDAIESDRPRRS
jgi:hypothetical protein